MAMAARTWTLVGVYEQRLQAETALNALRQAGFPTDQIGAVIHGENSPEDSAELCAPGAGGPEDRPVAGAIGGGTLGAILGAVASGLIPGVGPVLAGGLLAGVVGGAAVGAAGGALVVHLARVGISTEEAAYCERQFRTGRNLVVVRSRERHMEAYDLLRRFDPLYIQDPGNRAIYSKRGVEDVDRFDESGANSEEGAEETPPTTVFEVGIVGVAAAGEGSPRETYGEGAMRQSLPSNFVAGPEGTTISRAGAVREGSTGASFGEATTGGGTVRAGSTGGGAIGTGSPGSTHDVGVRGPGTVGEGRTRLERWREPLLRRRGGPKRSGESDRQDES